MQTNQNSKTLFIEDKNNRDEFHLSDQSKRKAAIQEKIIAYLKLINIEA